MGNDASADEAALLRREARAMIDTARAMLTRAHKLSPEHGDSDPAVVDFDALPGRSAEGRAEALLMGRRIRDRLFPEGLFHEPAWDLLLGLFLAERTGAPVSIAAAMELSQVSPATAARFVAHLEELGLVERGDSSVAPAGRDVRLSRNGLALMTRFFAVTEGRAVVATAGHARMRVVASRSGEGD